MPSIYQFFRNTKERIQRVLLGYKVMDKLRILCIAALQSVPLNIMNRISSLEEKIEAITEKLWSYTIIELDGIKYALLDFESFRIISSPERFTLMWLKPRRGEVLVDIGAHIGKYALTTAKVVGNEGMVVAIEPHPVNYQTLKRNIGLNKLENLMAFNLAAWDTDGKLKLFTGDSAGQHSTKLNKGLGWTEVKARIMDHVLIELGLKRVDWIKIDVEGAECEVLYGLEGTVTSCRPKIITEVFYENADKVKRFMKEHEYGLIRISPFLGGNFYFLCIPFSKRLTARTAMNSTRSRSEC